ncbi:DUF3667 domain-containing protein [Mucilaginibacter terrae]|uniref:DUF3667 domain-containing protein n=1 Tax=Mucilaginibacter terrae TaxID=1955052 RepID=UPI003670AF7D
MWHVDKGILFTLKELLTNPGNSVREFVQGRRANYYNFITLILLIVGVNSLLSQYTHFRVSDLMSESTKNTLNDFEKFTTKYPKFVLLIQIPITAFFSFIWFKKAKFNYSEHLVLNSYKASVELLIGLLFSVITIFYTNIKGLTIIYYLGLQLIMIVYGFWFYYQFFSKSAFSKVSLIVKSIMATMSIWLLSLIIGIIVGIVNIVKH